jgi:protein-tyrosine phosphatase
MEEQDIERVCCLLSEKLEYYDSLLERYQIEFGPQKVRHAPIGDYGIVSDDTFHEAILPFLREAVDESEKVVVHRSAGIGRTGHILALWLVYGRGYGLEDAIATVRQTGRNPLEAASQEQLREICSESR